MEQNNHELPPEAAENSASAGGDALIAELLKNRVSYLADSGPDEDIAISSRIRLARNLSDVPFPSAASPEDFRAVAERVTRAIRVTRALGNKHFHFQLHNMSSLNRNILFERRLASRELLTRPAGAEVHVRADESCAVMVNEEDHLRIQALSPGFQLEKVWKKIDRLDDRLSGMLHYAYHDKLGFLTACPSNVGTGMRASVMLHLPGLALSGQLTQAIQGIGKLGLAVRGIYGEGTDNRGNLFQISNQSTLGESELQIIERISHVVAQVIMHEKNARGNLLARHQYQLLDKVGRAYGVLRHSYILNSEEAINSLSALRFGVDMKMFSALDIHTVNELFLLMNSAHLQKCAGHALENETEENVYRAALVRERLKQLGN